MVLLGVAMYIGLQSFFLYRRLDLELDRGTLRKMMIMMIMMMMIMIRMMTGKVACRLRETCRETQKQGLLPYRKSRLVLLFRLPP